ncbi:cuticle protein AM1159-like [Panulirus ornatus]|uniref:cuticle protein AM1159-like n=1 Tax=Panulirus ornatus TaxID=150431 RepID=UPI003A8BF884
MKFVVLALLATTVTAAPQIQDGLPIVKILSESRQDDGAGNFNYAFQADNGIAVEASGSPGSQGQSVMQGSFSFPVPDGSVAEFHYFADEFGYQPQSSLLPTPHPLPAHVPELLRIAEEQRAAGIVFK